MAEQSAPIILVPGFWLGAWAWDEVADTLRADGHDVTALTLPGMESKDADRSNITFEDHVNAIVDAVNAADAPVVLAVHSATGFTGYAASDRVPERIAAMVYVDTAPGNRAPGPGLRRRREADGLERDRGGGEPRRAERGAEGDVPRAGRPGPRPRPAGFVRADERRAPRHPEHADLHGVHRGAVPDVREAGARGVVPRRHPRAPERHLGRPADQPLADVVAPDRARADHRRGRQGSAWPPFGERHGRDQPRASSASPRASRTGASWPMARTRSSGTESFAAGSRLVGAIGELPDDR